MFTLSNTLSEAEILETAKINRVQEGFPLNKTRQRKLSTAFISQRHFRSSQDWPTGGKPPLEMLPSVPPKGETTIAYSKHYARRAREPAYLPTNQKSYESESGHEIARVIPDYRRPTFP
ncbi:hypothetical protein M0804_011652 [Polistes exclamans]|nr:hypothetical protein M0804_011652 [Polistes exclamans]